MEQHSNQISEKLSIGNSIYKVKNRGRNAPIFLDNTNLESYDFSGKTIILFAISGGSGFGKTADNLKESVSSDTKSIEGKLWNQGCNVKILKEWVELLNL